MFLKLKYKSDRPVNFQFGEVGVLIGVESTEVDDEYGKALLEQFPDWVQKGKQPAPEKQ
ncbi:hypothetical protein [Dyadobacter sp. 32]|uniref:hypothetical protein n=1 Tax=Dyadobacter sp. 32 TaxID=538966 RepID=UPI0039C65E45